MLIKVDIQNEIFQKIKQLIDEGKYQDLHQFVTISINNQIHEESAKIKSESPFFSQEVTPSKSDYAKLFSETKLESNLSPNFEWRKSLENIVPLDSEIESKDSDLIWSFYNRFLPVKIVIYQLAKLVVTKGEWIELSELQIQSYQLALKISESLREYEEQNNIGRNQKLSTGLPTPQSELDGVKRITERRKIVDKINSSHKRFIEQFVGRKISHEKYDEFKGACFDMGLMAVKFSGDYTLVYLTQSGKEFALLENPILDIQKKDVAFYHIETDFILKKIITKFNLEKIIVNVILQNLKKDKLSAKEINEIFKEEKMKFLKEKGESVEKIEEHTEDEVITPERVATMGRLSELGLVKWDIDKTGQSLYLLKTINTE